MPGIRAFVGLGNPGDEYAATRHNVGFWLIDALAEYYNAHWNLHKKTQGLYTSIISTGEGALSSVPKGDKIHLFKPMLYMNRSGICVASLLKFFALDSSEQLCVIHDELDLPAGEVRLKFQGGAGGHNGLKDIISHLNTRDFYRLRIGISHPGQAHLVTNYVLKAPGLSDKKLIDQAIERAQDEFAGLLAGDFSSVMQSLNSVKFK